MDRYLVLTGARAFPVEALTPKTALEILKMRLNKRRADDPKPDPQIGMSLARAYADGRLNFLVVDGARTQIFCGEYKGQFCEPPLPYELLVSFRRLIPESLLYIPAEIPASSPSWF